MSDKHKSTHGYMEWCFTSKMQELVIRVVLLNGENGKAHKAYKFTDAEDK